MGQGVRLDDDLAWRRKVGQSRVSWSILAAGPGLGAALGLVLGLLLAWRCNPKSRKEGKGNVGPSLTGG